MRVVNCKLERYQDLAQSSDAGAKALEPIWTTCIGMEWMALDIASLQITK